MGLQGNQIDGLFPSRKAARAINCDANGIPQNPLSKRQVSFTQNNPRAGLWDLHTFGVYKYSQSQFKLRVDYLNAQTSIKTIEGPLSQANGSFDFTITESSMKTAPQASQSHFELANLSIAKSSQVAKGSFVLIPGEKGLFHSYSTEVKSVTVTTGDSTGNDIDLSIFQCDEGAKTPEDPSCQTIAKSGGATDQEKASFKPIAKKTYLIRVDGYEMINAGQFTARETLEFAPEYGTIEISGTAPNFLVHYSMPEGQMAASKLIQNPLFQTGKYEIQGEIALLSESKTPLFSIPVSLKK